MLRVGTDCSGIEAPIQGLLQCDIPFRHVFSCDIDSYCRESIRANYNPEKLYDDMMSRDHSTLPDMDLYVCGFPCTPYSNVGFKKGSCDPRSSPMRECLRVIQIKKPQMFILENVVAFWRIEGGAPYDGLIASLDELGVYDINTTVLNSKDFGIPQNRTRMFITGVKRSSLVRPLNLRADPNKLRRPLDGFLLEHKVYSSKPNATVQRNVDTITDTQGPSGDNSVNYIASSQLFGGTNKPMREMCPTLTCSSSSLWLTKYKRRFHPSEMLLLQGFPLAFHQVVSNTQMIKQAGNSMTVPVIQAVIEALVDCVSPFVQSQ
jgi:DNA (cytosine-5)-methyltransferase 1